MLKQQSVCTSNNDRFVSWGLRSSQTVQPAFFFCLVCSLASASVDWSVYDALHIVQWLNILQGNITDHWINTTNANAGSVSKKQQIPVHWPDLAKIECRNCFVPTVAKGVLCQEPTPREYIIGINKSAENTEASLLWDVAWNQ